MMNSVNFYHLKKTNTYLALCKLLEKAFRKNYKVLVRTDSEVACDEIDEILWSYEQSSFLPHSKKGDDQTHFSPIYITNEIDNPTNAGCLFILNTSNFSASEVLNFERTFILFNNDDKDFIGVARKFWADIGSFELERKYWVEEKKGWVLKNET